MQNKISCIYLAATNCNRPEFDPLFDLAEYANLNEEERNMYNDSLKHKWDNENVMDYAVNTARSEGRAEERAKSEKEKNELARNTALKLKSNKISLKIIAEATGLSLEAVKAL